MFLPLLREHQFFGGYKYTLYDIQLKGCKRTFLQDEETIKHIDYALKSNLIFLPIINTKNNLVHQVDGASVYADSLNEIFEIVPKTLFIDYDLDIINKGNSVFITDGIADRIKVKVGDTVSIIDDDYKIAGIYESCVGKVIQDMLILDKEFPKGPKEPYYTRVYVKLNDYKRDLKYFEDNYINHKSLWFKYGDEWETVVKQEELEEYRKGSFTTRILSLREGKDQWNEGHSEKEKVMQITLCLIAFFTTNIYTYYKHAKINKKKFAMLRIAGCPKYIIFMYYILKSLFEQLIILSLSLLFIGFNLIGNTYVSKALMLSWIGIILLIILSASIISGVIALNNVRDTILMQSIREERV